MASGSQEGWGKLLMKRATPNEDEARKSIKSPGAGVLPLILLIGVGIAALVLNDRYSSIPEKARGWYVVYKPEGFMFHNESEDRAYLERSECLEAMRSYINISSRFHLDPAGWECEFWAGSEPSP
jgi:hypothetical protein